MTAQGDAEASHMQGCLRTPYIIGNPEFVAIRASLVQIFHHRQQGNSSCCDAFVKRKSIATTERCP